MVEICSPGFVRSFFFILPGGEDVEELSQLACENLVNPSPFFSAALCLSFRS